MYMDYSEAFELLNQDAEKERNKKAEKAVHDNLYNKGFRDGLAILDKIRAEIIAKDKNVKAIRSDGCCFFTADEILNILNKYKAESAVLN